MKDPLTPFVLDQIGAEMIATGVRRARKRYDNFVEFTLQDETGAPIKMAAIHKMWRIHVEYCWKAGKHPFILAPWSHGKTTQLVIGRIAYELGQDVTLRTKVVCNDDDSAKNRVTTLGQVLRSKEYRLVFPHVKPADTDKVYGVRRKWTQHDILIHRPGLAVDVSISAYGVFSTGVGGRADLLAFDDVVDERNAILQPKDRVKLIRTCSNTWMGRLSPRGRVLGVGTLWHLEDWYHYLMKSPAWCILRMWIADTKDRIECEVYNPPAGYPIPRYTPPKRSLAVM